MTRGADWTGVSTMRSRNTIGPQNWSQEVLDHVALKTENNYYAKVDKKTVDKWHEYIKSSSESDRTAMQRAFSK